MDTKPFPQYHLPEEYFILLVTKCHKKTGEPVPMPIDRIESDILAHFEVSQN